MFVHTHSFVGPNYILHLFALFSKQVKQTYLLYVDNANFCTVTQFQLSTECYILTPSINLLVQSVFCLLVFLEDKVAYVSFPYPQASSSFYKCLLKVARSLSLWREITARFYEIRSDKMRTGFQCLKWMTSDTYYPS